MPVIRIVFIAFFIFMATAMTAHADESYYKSHEEENSLLKDPNAKNELLSKHQEGMVIENPVPYYRDAGPISWSLYYIFHNKPRARGDVNEDRRVTCEDYDIVYYALNSVPGDKNWDRRADLVSDNVVNSNDMDAVEEQLSYDAECGEMMP